MPGKYPTITSPITTRTTLSAGGTDGLSNSSKETLRTMFPNSPIYSWKGFTVEGEMVVQFLADCEALLQPAVQEGDSDQWGPDGVNLDYADAPNLDITPSDRDSMYYPNLRANSEPSGGEGIKIGSTLTPNDNFGTGTAYGDPTAPVAITPKSTSDKIAETSINTIGPVGAQGQSPAHSVNPGALSS